MKINSAFEIVTRAIEAAGEAGGIAEVEAIAANGVGAMTFAARDLAILIEAYGSPGDAMHAIQLEAQRQVSR
jgi:N-formylglutamate amidohydrolase